MKSLVARQPIMNLKDKTIAYELLLKNTKEKIKKDNIEKSEAITEILKNILINFDIKKISGGKKILINFTEKLILEEMPTILNKSEVIIEISEKIICYNEIVKKIKLLSDKGYIFSIDEFIIGENEESMLEFIKIIRVDFNKYSRENIIKIAKKFKDTNKVLLAKNINTKKEYKFAESIGFELFQGNYFLEAEILETDSIASIPNVYLKLIDEINKEEINYSNLAEIIKTDTALTYSFLKIVNSVAYYSRRNIKSIKNAITRLGLKEDKKIIYFNFLKSMKPEDTIDELLKKSLIRAKQAENLAVEYGMEGNKEDLFLLGLFSLINIILKKDMKSIVDKLPLKDQVKNSLLGYKNNYSKVIDLIIINEKNKMEELENNLSINSITIERFSEIYFDSISWADAIVD